MRIALLWHMHQPDYRHPLTGIEQMPWVRLHALKNYYDMARLAQEAPPDVRMSFNLTPVLLSQLRDIVKRGPRDPLYQLCREPLDRLAPRERGFLGRQLFAANEERQIRPVSGYARLLRRARGATPGPVQSGQLPDEDPALFSDQELLDLQVFFHLAWTGRTLREDPFVQDLLANDEGGFRISERDRLLDLQRSFLGQVVASYRRLRDEGRIELSTTPLHHPILPLLCDTQAAREGNPRVELQGLDFRFPQDAREQLERGLDLAEQELGRRPKGMWPSEGSLSEPVLRLMEQLDLRWVATDRQVLRNSLQAAGQSTGELDHLTPWRLAGTRGPAVFFRDTDLSDRIGFTYARWDANRAAADFLQRAQELLRAAPDPAQACLPVILDGENAWEFYAGHGVRFLQRLYQALDGAQDLQAVTMGEALHATRIHELPAYRAGSWICGCLDTWIGHPEKNRAWALLGHTRQLLETCRQESEVPAESLRQAHEILLRAEASDWFWWLGDDHPSPHKAAFDALFRTNLRAAWRVLGRMAPAEYRRPIAVGEGRVRIVTPSARIQPRIDGLDRRYYDWLGAGRFDARQQSGAMALAEEPVSRLDFGFGQSQLFLRLVPTRAWSAEQLDRLRIEIELRDPRCAWQLGWRNATDGTLEPEAGPDDIVTEPGRWAAREVLECALPLGPREPGSVLSLSLELRLGDGQVQRMPLDGAIALQVPGSEFEARHWMV